MQRTYTRVTTYPIAQILPLIKLEGNEHATRTSLAGYIVGVSSLRLRLFATQPLVCVSCQRTPSYFGLDLPYDCKNPHLNLYGLREDGSELLFTKDHILERCMGGPDTLANMQVMCAPCNVRKSAHRQTPKQPKKVKEPRERFYGIPSPS